mmetsp:Transcript_2338/g.6125  ORF Transcript_2338/g.6125 Transcript_2338/m.6125 type:complete len:120 (+) Transcript_2338:1061-1420(+)
MYAHRIIHSNTYDNQIEAIKVELSSNNIVVLFEFMHRCAVALIVYWNVTRLDTEGFPGKHHGMRMRACLLGRLQCDSTAAAAATTTTSTATTSSATVTDASALFQRLPMRTTPSRRPTS